jgi:hypothetical protein
MAALGRRFGVNVNCKQTFPAAKTRLYARIAALILEVMTENAR